MVARNQARTWNPWFPSESHQPPRYAPFAFGEILWKPTVSIEFRINWQKLYGNIVVPQNFYVSNLGKISQWYLKLKNSFKIQWISRMYLFFDNCSIRTVIIISVLKNKFYYQHKQLEIIKRVSFHCFSFFYFLLVNKKLFPSNSKQYFLQKNIRIKKRNKAT